MGYEVSERVAEIKARLEAFMEEHVYPREHDWNEFTLNQDNLWQTPDWFDELRELAKAEGLWNLFLPSESGLSVLDYAGLAEVTADPAVAAGPDFAAVVPGGCGRHVAVPAAPDWRHVRDGVRPGQQHQRGRHQL